MIILKEKFESLPHIKEKLDGLDLDIRDWLYVAKNSSNADQVADMHWVNGAWYAYQEQWKKIDAIIRLVHNETSDYDLDDKIKGLLK